VVSELTQRTARTQPPAVPGRSHPSTQVANAWWVIAFAVWVLSSATPTAAYTGAIIMTGQTLSEGAVLVWRAVAATGPLLVAVVAVIAAPGRWRRVSVAACGVGAVLLTWASAAELWEITQSAQTSAVWLAVAAHALLFAAWSLAVPLRGLALLAPVLAGIERLVAVTAIPTAALIALRLGLPPTGVASAAIIVSSFVLPLTVVVISRWLGGLRAESCGILTRNG
jgi:hypothetical protein